MTQIELVTERYKITKKVGSESIVIFAEIDNDDNVTIYTYDNRGEFTFNKSNKDRLMAIGCALQEAADIVNNRRNQPA